MNYCKIVYKYNVKSLFNNVRTFSIASHSTIDMRRHDLVQCNKNTMRKTMLPLPDCKSNRRNFSIDGVVKWQEQTYQSISSSSLVTYLQDGLLYFHEATGFTWSATIITTTILIRALMTLPLSIYQNYILAKVENISLELKELVNELRKETSIAKKMYNLSDKQAAMLYRRSMKKQWRLLIERDNCHPLKATLLIWFQIPMWVCMSFAIRNLLNMYPPNPSAVITLMELQTGGFGWIPNLTVPDQSLILPITFGLVNLTIIEIQKMSKLREPSRLHNIFTNVFRGVSVLMIPVAATVPSCLCLYWTTSSLFGLAQNLCLLSPSLRRKLKIPEAPSELEDPYRHMKEEISLRIKKVLPKGSS